MNESIYKVSKIKGPIYVNSTVPSSKSILSRALILSALADGECTLNNVRLSQDTRTILVALRDLGFKVFFSASMKMVKVTGMKGEIPKKEATVYVGNSATAARFLTGMLAMSDGSYVINADASLVRRDMSELLGNIRKIGAKVTCLGKKGHFPIRIDGRRPKENKDFNCIIDISQNTHFASALLMILPVLNCKSKVSTVGSSRDAYIQTTLKMIDRFGLHITSMQNEYFYEGNGYYNCGEYDIETDVSSACYFYTLPMLLGGSCFVDGICEDSLQGDMAYLDILEKMGAKVNKEEEGTSLSSDGKIFADEMVVDMENLSDQFANLAVLAATRKGKTTIENIEHLRYQECDRISVVKENLERCGIFCSETSASLTINGGNPRGAIIDSHGDHRTAMAFTILGLRTGNMSIPDYEYVGKTFPEFFEEIEKIKRIK